MPNRKASIQNFDYLRAIAALLVFVSHLFQIYWLPIVGLHSGTQNVVHILSESAVLVFFVLSGYVISMSLKNNINRHNHNFIASEYFINRIARIYPPLIVAVLISLISYQLIVYLKLPGSANFILGAFNDEYYTREYLHVTYREIITSIILYGGLLEINGPLWSLYIEVKMYVLAGLVMMLMYSKSKYIKVLALLLLALILNKLFPESKSYYYPMWWIIGVFLYFGKNYLMKSLLFTLALIILYLLSDKENIYTTILQLIVIYTFFLTALKYKFGQWPVLSKIASFSYSLYLFHFPIFLLIYSCFSYFHQTIQPTLAERTIVSVVASIIAFYFSKVIGAHAENVIFFKKLITSSYSKVVRN